MANRGNSMHTHLNYKIGILAGALIMAQAQGMAPHDKIYVAGHNGLVGSAIMRELQHQGYTNVITRSSHELDLRDQQAVNNFFKAAKPECVILAAARVGGIQANINAPGAFLYDNLVIMTNVIHAAYLHGVKKLLFLGSSCIYPREAPQPMKEEYLLTSPLEPTNEGYSLAKIAGIKLCQNYNKQYGTHFICCMPSNIYGPCDNFNPQTGHALPALMVRMLEAKKNNLPSVTLWGTGSARREWLYTDDLARACLFLMNNYSENDFVNVGIGIDVSMRELAEKIKKIVGYTGTLIFDSSKPEGMPRKLLDVSRMTALGWHASVDLDEGIKRTLAWYEHNKSAIKK